MKTIYLLAGCLFFITIANAQLPGFQWVKNLEGANGKRLTTDVFANVYTLGTLGAAGNHDFDPGPGTYFLDGANGTGFISKLNTNGDFVWAKQLPTNSQPEGIFVDAAQNVYVTGQHSLTADFDPGPGVFNLTAQAQNDIYILKLDAAGDFVWAKSLGGMQSDIGYALTVGSTGMVYTTGYFTGTADFDPGPGTFNMTAGFSNCFISALNANGDFLWARQIAGAFNQAHSIVTDAAGNLVIGGIFSNTPDFDPGAGTFNMTSAGSGDIFILRLDGNGNFLSAKSVGGIGSDRSETVAVDPLGNIYVGGLFSFTPDFDPGPAVVNLTASGSSDMFFLKLDAAGNFVWVKQIGGSTAEGIFDVKSDAAGNVYATGIFQSTVDFDPGAGIHDLVSAGDNDIFILKLNTDGNFGWAVSFGGTSSEDEGNGISVDAIGNIYTAGNFMESIDFDPGPGTAILTRSPNSVFVHKMGASGGPLPVSLVSFSGAATPKGNALQWQTSQEINTGYFELQWGKDGRHFNTVISLAAAGNSTGNRQYDYLHPLPARGNNYYRLKMTDRNGRFTYSSVVTINFTAIIPNITVYPNPIEDLLQMNVQSIKMEHVILTLQTADGKIIATKSFALQKGGNHLSWPLAMLPAGNYFISSGNKNFETIRITKR